MTPTMDAPQAQTHSLTLYSLTDELAQLMALRAEMAENAEDTAAIDGEIAVYLQRLPEKVDAVAAILRILDSQVGLAADEVQRLNQRRRRLAAAREKLAGYVCDILSQLPEPKRGSRKLEGGTATLALVRNGGAEPLDVYDESLVPDEYCVAVVKIPWAKWLDIREFADCPPANVEREVNNKAVREALAAPCWACEGTGIIPTDTPSETTPCNCCMGDGKGSVPGAKLMERGSRLEIR